jgi:hypothetical protein
MNQAAQPITQLKEARCRHPHGVLLGLPSVNTACTPQKKEK